MFKRFQRNSQLGVITLLGLTTAFTLGLFAIYRTVRGEWSAAWIDAAIVVLISGAVTYALRTGRTAGPGAFMCASNSLGCAVACWIIGPASLPWIYLVLMTNFFIAGSRQALVFNLLLTVAVLLMPGMFTQPIDRISAAVAAALVTLFAYLFALRVSSDHQQLEELASLDALTGLPNRRMMERALEAAVFKNRNGTRSYGLVIVDIDHFKEVNDSYGHAAGDAAIADLATILKFEMRKQDHAFRFGGEEFVVLLGVDSHEGLRAASERLRQAVRNGLRGPGGRITVSLGGAMAGDEERWQEWFSLADAALYRAKNNGRDSCIIAGASAPEEAAPIGERK
ncbi:MAG TPA: GGDEF domain-containing protein [Pseudoxanthomonas sp.]|nr:GGDEF domain-containing protein [Pseudoxanthomonas sp.]